MINKKRNWINMNIPSVGINVGEQYSVVTYISPNGDIIDHFEFEMNENGFNEFNKRIPYNVSIAFEASGLPYVVTKKLKSLGYSNITVAHPKNLAWITKSKHKNDHVDSIKLAKLNLVGMIPESHLLDDEERIFRDLLIQRVKLDQEIGYVKNAIISYLKREVVFNNLPGTKDNFSKKKRKEMKKIRFGNENDLVLQSMFERLELYESQAKIFENKIKERARENENIKLLMTIRGVDYYLASLLMSYIQNINRFENEGKLASFFGIVPSNRDSSSITQRGRMSKEGASTARWALSIAVTTVMRYN
ncbi:MAG: transposase, partial [Thermoplasmata archaeon]